MPNITGGVYYDPNRTKAALDSQRLGNYVVILQNTQTLEYSAVMANANSPGYEFRSVPAGEYSIAVYKTFDGIIGSGDWTGEQGTEAIKSIAPTYEELSSDRTLPDGANATAFVGAATIKTMFGSDTLDSQNFFIAPASYRAAPVDISKKIGDINLVTDFDNGKFVPQPIGFTDISPSAMPYPIGSAFAYTQLTAGMIQPEHWTMVNKLSTNPRCVGNEWWRVANHSGDETSSMVLMRSGMNVDVPILRTTINVNPNTNYRFSFWAMRFEKFTPDAFAFKMRAVDESDDIVAEAITDPLLLGTDFPIWTQYALDFNSGSNGIINLSINIMNTNAFFAFDSIALNAVVDRPVIINQSNVGLDLCDTPVTIASNETVAEELKLSLKKYQSCPLYVVGMTMKYCVEVTNDSSVPLYDLRWSDLLDSKLTYVTGSFKVDGVDQTPTIIGQELSYMIDTIASGQTIEICFSAIVG
ncbi:MAG: hypothetical protein FWC80_00060 [Firmicutes bacterium]|nr:hypothetical protein [Bacillota bacterium]